MPQLGQQGPDGGDPQPNLELLLDQQRNNAARPQTEIEPVLARVTAVDPAKHLTFLRWRQCARPSGRQSRAQRAHATSTAGRRVEPLVDHRAMKAQGGDHRRGLLAFPDSLHRHPTHLFERLMIQCASVTFHISLIGKLTL